MQHVSVKLKATHGSVSYPEYQSKGASGADVHAHIDKPIPLDPGKICTVPTGISAEIPEGYELQVRSRSGLASKYGVVVLNAPGTIDSDYRGEIQVVLINHGPNIFVITPDMRIAQLVLAHCVRADYEFTDEISTTERGQGGLGSTGMKRVKK
jgi:dUTP pyrophosphatase